MIFDHRFKITWDESVSQFAQDLPWMMIGALIGFGTLVVTVLIILIGGKCLGRKDPNNHFADRAIDWDRKTRRARRSYARVFFIILAVIFFFFGFWISFSVMGVSFWNIIFGTGILVGILLTGFGPTILCLCSHFVIVLSDKLEEDWYVRIVENPNVHGFVKDIGFLDVELFRKDQADIVGKSFRIPTSAFISPHTIERVYEMENRRGR